jgi:hypothetical protein
MRREDRDKLVEELKERIVAPWRIEELGSDSGEYGVQLVNPQSDTIQLIGVVDSVRRADRVLRVLCRGIWVSRFSGKSYKGRGWHAKAVTDMISMMSQIGLIRSDHTSLMMSELEGSVPSAWSMRPVDSLSLKGSGIELAGPSSDLVRGVKSDGDPNGGEHALRVFVRGRWSTEICGETFDGEGMHARAAAAVLKTIEAVSGIRAL